MAMPARIFVFLLFSVQLSGAFARAGAGPLRYQEPAQPAAWGLAVVDSLLAADQPGLAVVRIQDLLNDYGDDPVYGWQLEDRLGVALMRDGHSLLALPHLEKTVRRDPNSWLGHRNIGAALMALGRRGRALSEYQQAVESAPGNFEVNLEFGQILMEFGNHVEAAIYLEAARKLCPDCPEIRPALAQLHMETGKLGPAIRILQDLYREDPNRSHRRTLVQALQTAGRDSLLWSLWSKVPLAELDPDEVFLLVEIEGRLDSFEYSLEFTRGLSVEGNFFPDLGETGRTLAENPGFWGAICLNLLQAGHFQEALEAIDRAVYLAPDEVVYLNNRVVLLTKLGRYEEATTEWNKVLEMEPGLADQEAR
ncbi:MAG: tetratricopeptide repeat protein [Gemmatimonadales bacterium]|nr:tetratricopeptide repeat protein [Gemmatimonadales bacterium]